MRLFLIKLSLFSLLVGVCNFFFENHAGEQYRVKHLWQVFTFFVLTTAVFHTVITKASAGNPQSFIRKYMGITALRLFFFIGIILAYRFAFGKEQAIPFALAFIVHYFLYTIFEVSVLLKQLKSEK